MPPPNGSFSTTGYTINAISSIRPAERCVSRKRRAQPPLADPRRNRRETNQPARTDWPPARLRQITSNPTNVMPDIAVAIGRPMPT